MRFALKDAGLALEDMICGILPLGKGQKAVPPGRIMGLRLILNASGLAAIAGIAEALLRPSQQVGFSAKTLELRAVFNAADGGKLWPEKNSDTPFGQEILAPEMEILASLAEFELQFISPLRLPAPGARRANGRDRYCQADFFSGGDLGRLLSLGRGESFCGEAPEVLESRLHWEDMRYNAGRKIALGGLVGTLGCRNKANADAMTALIMGQYLGAGKNPRFGLGYWRIRELDQARVIPLPD